jgi:hypothetical protein
MIKMDILRSFKILIIIGLPMVFANAQTSQVVADKKFDMGYYTQAMEIYSGLAYNGELGLEGYLKLGKSYLKLNEPFTAESYLHVGKRKDTESSIPEFSLYLGHAAMQQANYSGARQQYLEYAAHDPETGRQLASNARKAKDIVRSESVAKVYNMPWNSPGAEMSLSMFDQRLVFTSRATHDMNNCPGWECTTDGGLISTLERSSYEVAGPLRGELRRDQPVTMVSYSGCGTKVAFVREGLDPNSSKADPSSNAMSLYIADVDESGDWDVASSFPYNSARFSSGFPFMNADGTVLYFASNKPGGFGGFDLYKSSLENGEWSKPENLGPEINSPGNEVSPFVMDDLLLFSSDWHPGMGGLDIFYTSLSYPTNIVNAGRGINSTRDDFGIWLSEDQQSGYFISNRPGGRGLEDIYGFSADEPFINLEPEPVALMETEEKAAETRENWVRFNPEFYTGIQTAEVAAMVGEEATEELTEEISEEAYENDSYELIEIDRRTNRHPLVRFASTFLDEKRNSENSGRLRNNYTIQVASLRGEFDDAEFARKLGDVGDVFKVFYNTDIKIRVGSYNTREMAESALPEVRNRGFTDAFIVLEQIVVNPARGEKGANTAASPSGQIASSSEEPGNAIQTPTPTYYVRLGAFRDLRFFDETNWSDYEVVKKNNGDLTVIMVGGFDRIEDIEAVRLKAIRNGYTDAFIVIEYGGEQKRY